MEILLENLPGDTDDLEKISTDAVEEDGTPVLDEEDLEENNLTEEEAEQIIWEEPKGKKGSSGSEEKDITD